MTTLKEEEERTGLAGEKDAQSGSRTQKADLTVLTGWGRNRCQVLCWPGEESGHLTCSVCRFCPGNVAPAGRTLNRIRI